MKTKNEPVLNSIFLENTSVLVRGIMHLYELSLDMDGNYIRELCQRNIDKAQKENCNDYILRNLVEFIKTGEIANEVVSLTDKGEKRDKTAINNKVAGKIAFDLCELFAELKGLPRHFGLDKREIALRYTEICDIARNIFKNYTRIHRGHIMVYLVHSSGTDHAILANSRPYSTYNEKISQKEELDTLIYQLLYKADDSEHCRLGNTLYKARYQSIKIEDVIIDEDEVVAEADEADAEDLKEKEKTGDQTESEKHEISAEAKQEEKKTLIRFVLANNIIVEKEIFHIIIEYYQSDECTKSVKINLNELGACRALLCFRELFISNMQEDLGYLLLKRNTYQLVTPINKMVTRIMHISDLHISSDNDYTKHIDIISNSNYIKNNKPDLLVITGDLVQANYSASKLVKNYQTAAEVLKSIACALWADDKKYIRDDWKKRIIIIPGNHDFAAMNELVVSNDNTHKRIVQLGRVTDHPNQASIKFSYMLEFLRDNFDINTGELANNGLNEVRNYDRLGITVLCLNTSIKNDYLRTNKVHLCKSYLNQVSEREGFDNTFVIALMHHTPLYMTNERNDDSFGNNYVRDNYLDYGFKSGEIIKQEMVNAWITELSRILNKTFVELALSADPKLLSEVKNQSNSTSEIEVIKSAYVAMKSLNEKIRDRFDEARNKDKDHNTIVAIEKMDFYKDLKVLIETEYDCTNEKRFEILSEMLRHIRMTETDNTVFQKTFEDNSKLFNVVLGGHTHCAGRGESEGVQCYEASRAFDKSNGKKYVQYSILEVEKETGNSCYIFKYEGDDAALGSIMPRCGKNVCFDYKYDVGRKSV